VTGVQTCALPIFHLDHVRATVRCINLSVITGLNFSQYNTVSCDSVEN
jgi:hypothetical protein